MRRSQQNPQQVAERQARIRENRRQQGIAPQTAEDRRRLEEARELMQRLQQVVQQREAQLPQEQQWPARRQQRPLVNSEAALAYLSARSGLQLRANPPSTSAENEEKVSRPN